MNIEKAKLIQGWIEDYELEIIANWASIPERQKIIEIGTWKGRTTRAICDNTNGIVITIDHWKGPLVPVDNGFWELETYDSDYVYKIFEDNLKDYLDSKKLFVLKMSSVDAAKQLIKKYGFESFGMLFIDGGHEYEIIKRDIVFFRPLLKMGGQLCGHDYYYPGIRQALDELFPVYWHEGNMWSKEI